MNKDLGKKIRKAIEDEFEKEILRAGAFGNKTEENRISRRYNSWIRKGRPILEDFRPKAEVVLKPSGQIAGADSVLRDDIDDVDVEDFEGVDYGR